MIWAKTSRVRGGAKDPEAAPAARVGHVMEELALLDEGGDEAAVMSADGFKAYADDSIWVSVIGTFGAAAPCLLWVWDLCAYTGLAVESHCCSCNSQVYWSMSMHAVHLGSCNRTLLHVIVCQCAGTFAFCRVCVPLVRLMMHPWIWRTLSR